MRVLVCGSRSYSDLEHVFETLSSFHAQRGIDLVIHGAAEGADRLAKKWAERHGVTDLPFPAQWLKFSKSAGPIRNQQMLDEGKPDVVIAFPGGRGTGDMVRRAKSSGVEVIEVKH